MAKRPDLDSLARERLSSVKDWDKKVKDIVNILKPYMRGLNISSSLRKELNIAMRSIPAMKKIGNEKSLNDHYVAMLAYIIYHSIYSVIK